MDNKNVELHVDPLCPWCWLTALWLYEVATVRPITITTRVFSLAEINRAEDVAREPDGEYTRPLRVLVAVRRAGGEEAITTVYRELGEAHHERDEPLAAIETLRAAVAAAGLGADLADEALADPSTFTEVLAEHAAAVERGAFGVPTLSIDGSVPIFGPIVDTRITGDDAGALWDLIVPVLASPAVLELKRHRTRRADVGRNRKPELAAS
jgi:predicted DsbA family dithiol-disulfide isomerase